MVTEVITAEVVEQPKEIVELDKVLNNSGLEKSETPEVRDNYLPFLNDLHNYKEQSAKINFDNPTEIDEKIARELRLKVVKVRTSAEGVKESRKKQYLLKGNVEQAAYNLIKANCELFEANLKAVEDARKIAEEKRKAEIANERLIELQKYNFTPAMNLGEMDEATYNNLLAGAKKTHDDKIEAERKAEEERKKAEWIATLHKERKDAILPLWQFVDAELRNDNFGIYSTEQWFEYVELLEERKSKFDAEQKRIADENARLKAEADEKEKALVEKGKLRDQRLQMLKVYNYVHETDVAELESNAFTKLLTEVKTSFEKAKEEKRLADQKAAEEKAKQESETARLQKIADDAAAELQKKKDAEAKAEADRLAAIEAEASKGDAAKFVDFMNELEGLLTKYEFKSAKYKKLYSAGAELIQKALTYLTDKNK